MQLSNTTPLDSHRLLQILQDAVRDWPVRRLQVKVRNSRGADFSGTCYYRHSLIHVNLGRHLHYPYHLGTSIARARSNAHSWWKPTYSIELRDGYQVVLFVFLHELYHWLIHRARRNPRQKESMCDRFAARILADRFGCRVRDANARPVRRELWDFQDVDAFVAAARTARSGTQRPRKAATRSTPQPLVRGTQYMLFDV
jgi:hypothetical protein